MSAPLRLRSLTADDLPFADSVRALAGWNQTLDDWRRLLAHEPSGCFLAEWNGQPAGTATTTVYGSELAWIGMVLVHPDYRRRGIGRALLRRCVDHLHERGVPSIKLDATPLGKSVYEGLRFRDEWILSRWVHSGFKTRTSASDSPGVNWADADDQEIKQLDASAFGVSRGEMLHPLVRQSRQALVLKSDRGRVAGYGLLRDGARARYLGPVVAATADAGLRLVEALLNRAEGAQVFWDIPDLNRAALEWAQAHGFTVQRSLTRMVLGPNRTPGDPTKQFALAGPEIG